MSERIIMKGVNESTDSGPVELGNYNGVWEIIANTGCCGTYVNLFQLLNWLRDNRPDLLGKCGLREDTVAIWDTGDARDE